MSPAIDVSLLKEWYRCSTSTECNALHSSGVPLPCGNFLVANLCHHSLQTSYRHVLHLGTLSRAHFKRSRPVFELQQVGISGES